MHYKRNLVKSISAYLGLCFHHNFNQLLMYISAEPVFIYSLFHSLVSSPSCTRSSVRILFRGEENSALLASRRPSEHSRGQGCSCSCKVKIVKSFFKKCNKSSGKLEIAGPIRQLALDPMPAHSALLI